MLRFSWLLIGLILSSCGEVSSEPIKISSTSGDLPPSTQKAEKESLIDDQFPLSQETLSMTLSTKGDEFFQARILYGDKVKAGDIVQFNVDLRSMEVEGFDIYQYIKYDSLENGKVIVNLIQIPILGSTLPTVDFPYEISQTTIGDADAIGFVLKYWVNGEQKELEQKIEYQIKKD